MLNFSLTGRIGSVLKTKDDELTLPISSVLCREGQPLRVAWVLCTARDPVLRAHILAHLREGDHVQVEGEIEQRRRQIGELAFHSLGFVIGSIERLPPPNEGGAS